MTIGDRIKRRRLAMDLTLQDLSDRAGVSRQTIFRYESGEIKNIPSDKIELIAAGLDVSPGYIMGWEEVAPPAPNLEIPRAYDIPVLGRICCGDGVFVAEQSVSGYFALDRSVKADYCLVARGDSMIDAGIDDGDRVFIKQVEDYEDGKIYGVVIRGEELASLKKVYHIENKVLLQACNSAYQPTILSQEDVCIVGECVGVYKSL
jgi:repressor LexA